METELAGTLLCIEEQHQEAALQCHGEQHLEVAQCLRVGHLEAALDLQEAGEEGKVYNHLAECLIIGR